MSIPICPCCTKAKTEDHRWCLVDLFSTNAIQDVQDWERMCDEHGWKVFSTSPEFKNAIKIQSFYRGRKVRRIYLANKKPKTVVKRRIRARVMKE